MGRHRHTDIYLQALQDSSRNAPDSLSDLYMMASKDKDDAKNPQVQAVQGLWGAVGKFWTETSRFFLLRFAHTM